MLQGWTQKDLAVASNLSQSAIGNYESGQRLQPSSDALIKLTRALRVNPMWLSTGEGPMLNPGYAEPATNAGNHPEQPPWPFETVSYATYAVSYTHLDVYKRQGCGGASRPAPGPSAPGCPW